MRKMEARLHGTNYMYIVISTTQFDPPLRTTPTMASPFTKTLRSIEPTFCRQCASTPARRTFASFATHNPQHEIRSRSPAIARLAIRQTTPQQQHARPLSSTTKRAYKTVQEAKSRGKIGVRCPIYHIYIHLPRDANSFVFSPSPGKPVYCSSPPVPA